MNAREIMAVQKKVVQRSTSKLHEEDKGLIKFEIYERICDC